MANKKTNPRSHHARTTQHEKKRSLRHRSNTRTNSHRSRRSKPLSLRQQNEKVRCLDALNLYRHGKAKSVSSAARSAGTTVRAIRRLVPAAITQDRPGGRIRVKASDWYSAKVQILTDEGAVTTTAHGSRERELAGRHRATVLRVLRGDEPLSALKQYRRKKVGGHELISNYAQLSSFAQAGIVGQLDTLYVSPDTSV